MIEEKRVKNKKNISIKKNRCRVPPSIDYAVYIPNRREWIVHLIQGSLFAAVVSWQFYDSVIAWFLMTPLVVWSIKNKCKMLCQKRKQKLEIEFREVIISVSTNLQAGYSIENAFEEAYKDIVLLYGRESAMAKELRFMFRRMGNNEQVEDALFDLAKRSGVQDIKDFADIFRIAKRGGGDIRGIIANTADIIAGKQEARREIETVISEKKLEQTIMKYMPFFIIFYVSFTTKGYFESLYHNKMGWIIMTTALVVYGSACKLSDKILEIEV